MTRSFRAPALPTSAVVPFVAMALFASACSDDEPSDVDAGGSTFADAGVADGGGSTTDGGMSDGGSTADGGVTTDGGADAGPVVVDCQNPAIPASTDTCSVTAGTGSHTLLRGAVVAPEGLLNNGHVLIDGSGKITCAACDCSAEAGFAEATTVECAQGVISPGLINAHEHLTYGEGSPIPTGEVRYDHRHEWRRGVRGAMSLNTPSGSSQTESVLYAELRHLLGGATSVAGSGGADGLLRNLDRTGTQQEGLDQARVRYNTFPLGDSSGTLRSSGCDYGTIDSPTDSDIASAIAYLPHISEGIDAEARNEFLCLSRTDSGGQDVLMDKTAFIHGVGMNALDYAAAAAEGASLVWSPRTNVSLYGLTAPVVTAKSLGVNIALGTDWPSSGSQNMLRELRCVSDLNERNYGKTFSDREIVDMATANGAAALKSDGKIGSLRAGHEADIAIFDGSTASGYRAIIEGSPASVALVMRSGNVLYGDASTVSALRSAGCESFSDTAPMDCLSGKQVCVMADASYTVAQLRAAVSSDTIALFSCTTPENEPSCVPFRSGEFTGMPTADDMDGDGIIDMADNCPSVFNPVRPIDPNMMQADTDGDLEGDSCDVCPLDADSTTCTPPDPSDRDADMVPNAMDNCPDVPNADQADADMDAIGDLCDRCPMTSNPGDSACPATIYAIKQGQMTGAVSVSGAMVTAEGSDGYFIQHVPGDADYDATLGASFSGLFIFDRGTTRPAEGDRVVVEGSVSEYYGQTQISATSLTIQSSGNTLPAPIVVEPAEVATDGGRAVEYEGVLIEVQNVSVSDAAPDGGQYNEFIVDGSLRVNDYFYLASPFPVMGQNLGYIRGILHYANSDHKLEPRRAEDLDQSPVVVSLEPATGFAPEMSATPVNLTVRLNRAVSSDTVVSVSSTGPVQVPSTVTVPTSTNAATIPVLTVAAATTPATITATLEMSSVTASLRVYSDTEARSISSLTLDSPSVQPTATVMGTVTLDIPAPTGGTAVSFSVSPSLATVATVTVPAGARTARFTVTPSGSEGTAVITGSVGASTAMVSLEISLVSMGVPSAAGDLVITEIMKNPVALSDTAGEWFEVYNPSASVIYELSGCTVRDDGSNSFSVGSSVTIRPGTYVTFAASAAPGFTPDYVWSSTALGNGDDEVELVCGGTVIDRVAYTDAAFPDTVGASMQLNPTLLSGAPHTSNDTGASWCDGSATYNTVGASVDYGTPGAVNSACP